MDKELTEYEIIEKYICGVTSYTQDRISELKRDASLKELMTMNGNKFVWILSQFSADLGIWGVNVIAFMKSTEHGREFKYVYLNTMDLEEIKRLIDFCVAA